VKALWIPTPLNALHLTKFSSTLLHTHTHTHCLGLRLSDGDFRAALRRRLGEPNLPHGARDAPCYCGTMLRSTNAEHALTCCAPHKLRVLRHDEIVDVVRRALWRGVLPSTKEPGLAVLHPRPTGPRPPPGARGDLLFSLEGQQCLSDVSVSTLEPPRTARQRRRDAEKGGGWVFCAG
jgi:hypothetical protein